MQKQSFCIIPKITSVFLWAGNKINSTQQKGAQHLLKYKCYAKVKIQYRCNNNETVKIPKALFQAVFGIFYYTFSIRLLQRDSELCKTSERRNITPLLYKKFLSCYNCMYSGVREEKFINGSFASIAEKTTDSSSFNNKG